MFDWAIFLVSLIVGIFLGYLAGLSHEGKFSKDTSDELTNLYNIMRCLLRDEISIEQARHQFYKLYNAHSVLEEEENELQ